MLNRNYILKLMNDKQWSQVDLAAYAGVSESAISRWLGGSRKGSTVMMQAIKKAFPQERAEDLFLFTQNVAYRQRYNRQ